MPRPKTGIAQAIVQPRLFRAARERLTSTNGLVVEGIVEQRDGAVSLRAERLWPLPGLPPVPSHDFR